MQKVPTSIHMYTQTQSNILDRPQHTPKPRVFPNFWQLSLAACQTISKIFQQPNVNPTKFLIADFKVSQFSPCMRQMCCSGLLWALIIASYCHVDESADKPSWTPTPSGFCTAGTMTMDRAIYSAGWTYWLIQKR